MKSALIIGHAGHELRVLKFIELLQPKRIFILTDGSGGQGISRTDSTEKILNKFHCYIHEVFFTDKQIYEIILNSEIQKIKKVRNTIQKILYEEEIGLVFGDSCEGFNPTHDLCRYIINSCVGHLDKEYSHKIKNYDFLLDNSPCFDSSNYSGVTIKLSEEDKLKRDELIAQYPEIQQEVELAKKKFGINDFDYECIREVKNHDFKNWAGDKPFYETYGQKKLAEGKYKDIITYDHIVRIANQLQ